MCRVVEDVRNRIVMQRNAHHTGMDGLGARVDDVSTKGGRPPLVGCIDQSGCVVAVCSEHGDGQGSAASVTQGRELDTAHETGQPHEVPEIDRHALCDLLSASDGHASAPIPLRCVAGLDVSYQSLETPSRCIGVMTMHAFPSLDLLGAVSVDMSITVPYEPGFLAFRELPVFRALFDGLARWLEGEETGGDVSNECHGARCGAGEEEIRVGLYGASAAANLFGQIARTKTKTEPGATSRIAPDVILVDGNGTWHTELCGSACHVGMLTSASVVGVAKTLMALGDNLKEKAVRRAYAACANHYESGGAKGDAHGGRSLKVVGDMASLCAVVDPPAEPSRSGWVAVEPPTAVWSTVKSDGVAGSEVEGHAHHCVRSADPILCRLFSVPACVEQRKPMFGDD